MLFQKKWSSKYISTLRKNADVLIVFFLLFLSSLHLVFALRTDAYFSQDDFFLLAYFKENGIVSMVPDFIRNGDIFGFRKVLGYVNLKIIFDQFGVNSVYYLINNYILHAANLILLYFVVKFLTTRRLVGLLSSIILNKYFFSYFSNVHEYLVLLFILISVYFFLRFPSKIYLSLSAFVLALFTKEISVTLPFLLLGLSIIKKESHKKTLPFFMVLFFYFIYQFSFIARGEIVPENQSYSISFELSDIIAGILHYVNPPLLAFLAITAIFSKNKKTLFILLVALMAMAPALVFKNRHEMYYFYVPVTYLLVYISLNIPKKIGTFAVLTIFLLLAFGGRQVFPLIAWQKFPNWQKISMENVLNKIEMSLDSDSDVVEINLDSVHLERDANLMLQTSTAKLFLGESVSKYCSLSYNQGDNSVIAKKQCDNAHSP